MSFKVGDVVRLKSGGPAMTVSFVRADAVFVFWFNRISTGENTFTTTEFKVEMLERADPE